MDSSKVKGLQLERLKIFESQDVEKDDFDITFVIDGKKLFANKYVLTTVSEPLKAMLSQRWKTKDDEPIKITNYSYQNFYQFLLFLYSDNCQLTDDNIFSMVDLAEYYGVSLLKDFCDKYFAFMELTADNFVEMIDFAEKYSLPESMYQFIYRINWNIAEWSKNEKFLLLKKSLIEAIASHERYFDDQEVFEAAYKWSEHQALTKKAESEDENFNLNKAIKNELTNMFDKLNFSFMKHEFVMNFLLEKWFVFPSFIDFCKSLVNCKRSGAEEEQWFKGIYQLAEDQAFEKQMESPSKSFNLKKAARSVLSDVLPDIQFSRMSQKFLKNFVVKNGVLIADEASRYLGYHIEVTNDGKILRGFFIDDYGIYEAVQEKRPYNAFANGKYRQRFWDRIPKSTFKIPTTPSTIQKMKGVNWYLLIDENGFLNVKHRSLVKNDFLIAEMTSENNDFIFNKGSETDIKIICTNL
jgi:hypothetical protein